jgi:hypothetical protein
MTTQDPRGVVTGIAAGAALNESDQGQRPDDDGVPVGAADRDADRVASGADPATAGDQDEPSLREVMFGDNALDDDTPTDQGEPVGLADRNADAERSS